MVAKAGPPPARISPYAATKPYGEDGVIVSVQILLGRGQKMFERLVDNSEEVGVINEADTGIPARMPQARPFLFRSLSSPLLLTVANELYSPMSQPMASMDLFLVHVMGS